MSMDARRFDRTAEWSTVILTPSVGAGARPLIFWRTERATWDASPVRPGSSRTTPGTPTAARAAIAAITGSVITHWARGARASSSGTVVAIGDTVSMCFSLSQQSAARSRGFMRRTGLPRSGPDAPVLSRPVLQRLPGPARAPRRRRRRKPAVGHREAHLHLHRALLSVTEIRQRRARTPSTESAAHRSTAATACSLICTPPGSAPGSASMW